MKSGTIAIMLGLAMIQASITSAQVQNPAVPRFINFQAFFTDNPAQGQPKPLEGPHDFIFNIYDNPNGTGTPWTEVYNGMNVRYGEVNVILGSTEALTTNHFRWPLVAGNQDRWLEVVVDNVRASMLPIVSAPYAYRASDAYLLGGSNTTAFLFRSGGTMIGDLIMQDPAVIQGIGIIDSAEITDGTITVDDIGNNAVGNLEMADNAVGSDEIIANSIAAVDIGTGAVDSDEIATGAVGTDEIALDSIAAVDIATGAVGTDEIALNTITADDIANNAVGSAEIDTGAVGTDEIANGAIGNADIAANAAIAGTKVAAATTDARGTVSGTDIQGWADDIATWGHANRVVNLNADMVDGSHASEFLLRSGGTMLGSITMNDNTRIWGTNVIDSLVIRTDAVGSDEIAAGAVGASEIDTGAVGSDEIATGAVGGDEIAKDAVGSDEIAKDAVGSDEIAAGAVGSSEIDTGAVGSDELANNAVTSGKINDGAVATADLADNAVTSGKINDGAVGTADIADGTIADADIAAGANIAGSKISPVFGSLDVTGAALVRSSLTVQNDIWLADGRELRSPGNFSIQAYGGHLSLNPSVGYVGIGTPSPNAGLDINRAGPWGSLAIRNQNITGGGTHFDHPDGKNWIRGPTVIADQGGQVIIGSTTPPDNLDISPAKFFVNGKTGIGEDFYVYKMGIMGSPVYPLNYDLDLYVHQNAGVVGTLYYGDAQDIDSDTRIKFDQTELDYGLAQVMALKPKRYNQAEWEYDKKNDKLVIHPDKVKNDIGLVAQEVHEVIPEAAHVPTNEDSQLWGMNYLKLIPVLVKAIQDQQKQIERLEEKIALLEKK